jgi:hypothetical protein
MRRALIIVFVLLLAGFASAQLGVGIPTGGLGNPPGITVTPPANVRVPFRPFGPNHRHGVVLPPFFGTFDGFWYGEYQPNPEIVYVEPEDTSKKQEAKKVYQYQPGEPIIIEQENGKWVRRRLTAANSEAERVQPQAENRPHARQLPPTVLVFHDGKRLEVPSYMITHGTLYAYDPVTGRNTGYSLAQLDLPLTRSLNEERGLQFRLPSGPDEVVMRP